MRINVDLVMADNIPYDGNKDSKEILGGKTENKLKAIVGIPAYNEENTIASIVFKAKRFVDHVVVVDDGSFDDTAELAELAGAEVIKHEENRGYGASLRTLILYARDNYGGPLVIIDADAQHPVNKIPSLLEKILSGEADITIGSRFLDADDKKNVPTYRRFGIKLLTWLSTSRVTFITPKGKIEKITNGQSGFRAFSKNALDKIVPKEKGMGASIEILMDAKNANLIIEEVPITVIYEGKTPSERPLKHGLGVIGSVIRYTETKHSLLSFGVPGLIAFLVGIYMGIRTVLIYNELGYWPVGQVFITVLLFFGGMAACMTGLILHAIINAHKRGFS